jgi:hypothetical protein
VRDGSIAEAPHGVPGLMEPHDDRGEWWPIPTTM